MENLQPNRVRPGVLPGGSRLGAGRGRLQQKVTAGLPGCCPARLDKDGVIFRCGNRRAAQALSLHREGSLQQPGLLPAAGKKQPGCFFRVAGRLHRFIHFFDDSNPCQALAADPGRDQLQLPLRMGETIKALVSLLEILPAALKSCLQLDRRLLPPVAQVEIPRAYLDMLLLDPFIEHLLPCLLLELRQEPAKLLRCDGIEKLENRFFSDLRDGGLRGSPGAEYSRQPGDDHPRDTELAGNRTGMLGAGTTESHQRVFSNIVATSQADFPDRRRHAVVSNLEEALGNLFEAPGIAPAAQAPGQGLEPFPDSIIIEWKGEPPGRYPPEKEVHVRNGQRPPGPIAGWPWNRACAVGADGQLFAVKITNRAATGGDGFNRQERRRDAHTRLKGLMLHLEAAVPATYIRAGPSHVESDCAARACLPGHLGGADHATGRTTEKRVLARIRPGRGQGARAGKKTQRRVGGCFANGGHIASYDRAEVGINESRITPGNQPGS